MPAVGGEAAGGGAAGVVGATGVFGALASATAGAAAGAAPGFGAAGWAVAGVSVLGMTAGRGVACARRCGAPASTLGAFEGGVAGVSEAETTVHPWAVTAELGVANRAGGGALVDVG